MGSRENELARLIIAALDRENDLREDNKLQLRVNYSPAMTLWDDKIPVAIVGTNPGVARDRRHRADDLLAGPRSGWEKQILHKILKQGSWLDERWVTDGNNSIPKNLKKIFKEALATRSDPDGGASSSPESVLRGTLYFNLCFIASRNMDKMYPFELFSEATKFILSNKKPTLILAFGNGERLSPFASLCDTYGGGSPVKQDSLIPKLNYSIKRTEITMAGQATRVYGLPHLSRFLIKHDTERSPLYSEMLSCLRSTLGYASPHRHP